MHSRIAYRLAIDIYCGERATRRHCHTLDIGLGGMFAIGALRLRPDDMLQISLGRREQGALQMLGRVARVSLDGAGLEFTDNSVVAVETLSELLTPDWDGQSLLEGVVNMAPWYQGNDLASWMRFTSMVSHWRRLTQPARREFQHSVRSGPGSGRGC